MRNRTSPFESLLIVPGFLLRAVDPIGQSFLASEFKGCKVTRDDTPGTTFYSSQARTTLLQAVACELRLPATCI
jgi:hypothetical protein